MLERGSGQLVEVEQKQELLKSVNRLSLLCRVGFEGR